MSDPISIQQLLTLYLSGEPVDENRLADIMADESNAELVKQIFNEHLAADPGERYNTLRFDQVFENVINIDRNGFIAPSRNVHFLKTTWFRYAAAIILLFGIGAYLWNNQINDKSLVTQQQPAPVNNYVPPGSTRAVLTLSNGQKVELNNAVSETIKDGNLSIENNDGQLIYRRGDLAAVNSMTTPRGGQYRLKLADGTSVWLNAESSISYPTTFNGPTREVRVEGEVFFEVQPNEKKPFVVRCSNNLITVLGTSFNVNSYGNEPFSKTTLIEGSIKINDAILRPGQAFENGKIVVADVEQDVAWMRGLFNFKGAGLPEVMRELERWYDIEVRYSGSVNDNYSFSGELQRSLTLDQALRILKKVNVNFKLEGRKLTVIQ